MSMWRIGHRGACGYAPENTLLSMRKALEMRVDGFEFDVQMSSDGEPMVIHDDTLERTTSGTGNVSDYTLNQLQMMDAGQGEAIPSLQDVFALVDKNCRLLIELKSELVTAPVADMVTYYAGKGWHYDQMLVCSFDHLQLVSVNVMNPDIKTCALLAGIPVNLAACASDAGAWAINPNVHHINQRLVDDAHERDLKVIIWTGNHPKDIAHMKELGVDGIISDFPDRI